MNEPTVHTLPTQPHDFLLRKASPVAMRLNDAHHQRINVGDLVEFSGHNTAMDRQRFGVVAKMNHPTIHDAVNQIKSSNLSVRDKIKMTNTFMGAHGAAAGSKPVVSLHLAPHPMPPGTMNRGVSSFGH